MPHKDMLHIVHQASEQGERVGQGIAYIGGSTLAMASSAMQDLPASPWVIDAALIVGALVVVGRLMLDVAKWRDRRDSSKRGNDERD